MRNSPFLGAAALLGLLAGGAAFAHVAPPAPGHDTPGPAGHDAAAGPPLPPEPGLAPPQGGRPPPPPPPGAHVVLDRGANGVVHVDVRCAERDSTEDCAGIATRMLDKVNGATSR